MIDLGVYVSNHTYTVKEIDLEMLKQSKVFLGIQSTLTQMSHFSYCLRPPCMDVSYYSISVHKS